jgi:hypothetical protein
MGPYGRTLSSSRKTCKLSVFGFSDPAARNASIARYSYVRTMPRLRIDLEPLREEISSMFFDGLSHQAILDHINKLRRTQGSYTISLHSLRI